MQDATPGAPLPLPIRTIALMNQKGGVGKTTTTVNLAAAIARTGRKVLVIDLDPQAHASLHLGVEPDSLDRPSVYDLLVEPDADIDAATIEVRDNLRLLAAETDLAAAETEIASAPDKHYRLARALGTLTDRPEFILLDCPPSLGLLTLNGLVAAREVIVPMQAHFLALQGVGKLLQTIQLVRSNLNPKLRVTGVVLCMHDKQATHTQEVVADLTQFFDDARDDENSPWRFARLLHPPIRRNIKLAECPSFGQSIYDYAPTAPGADDYTELASRLIAEWDRALGRIVESKPAADASSEPASPTPAETPAELPA